MPLPATYGTDEGERGLPALRGTCHARRKLRRRAIVKLRRTPISIPVEGVWLNAELAHAPDARALAVIIDATPAPAAGTDDVASAAATTPASDNPDARPAFPAPCSCTAALQAAGFATLRLALLSSYEASRDPDAAYNVPLLARRVLAALDWRDHQPPLAALAVGVIACGTACGAVIRAAAVAPQRIGAVVCHGGRLDLAGAGPLAALRTPLRLTVARDDPDAAMQQQAFERIAGMRDIQTVDDATAADHLAVDWLETHLPPPAATDAAGATELPTESARG